MPPRMVRMSAPPMSRRGTSVSSLTDHPSALWPEPTIYRPAYHDNSALRARLAGVKVEDRPILSELHRVMAERDAFAPQPAAR
jgi:hypothetical protein